MSGSKRTVFEVENEIEEKFRFDLQIWEEPRVVFIGYAGDRADILSSEEIIEIFAIVVEIIKIEDIKVLQFDVGVPVKQLPLDLMQKMKSLEDFRLDYIEQFDVSVLKNKPLHTLIIGPIISVVNNDEYIELPEEMDELLIGTRNRAKDPDSLMMKIVFPQKVNFLSLSRVQVNDKMISNINEIQKLEYTKEELKASEELINKLEKISDKVYSY